MGKTYDALMRYEQEHALKVQRLATDPPKEKKTGGNGKKLSLRSNGFPPKLVVISAPDSVDAEIFKVLRSQILFPEDGKAPRVVMVTSAFPGEGKTFVAANLAASIALGINDYVLAVDCDLRNPGLHRMLGRSNSQGLHEFLIGKRDLSELFVQTNIDKLTLLTAGAAPSNPSELISSSVMAGFLHEVKNRYEDRYVIIDTTPSQVTAEARVLAKHVDAVIFVIMAHRSPRAVIQRNIEYLGRDKILGLVFNGCDRSERQYQKYYGSYTN